MKFNGLLKMKEHKILFSILIVIVAIAVIIVAVNAKYVKQLNTLENTFTIASAKKPIITENFDKKVKKDVKTEGDGFYYYTEPVANKDTTDVLIKECQLVATPTEGYELSVNIITQTVQAVEHTDNDKFKAVFDAWGVDLSNASTL